MLRWLTVMAAAVVASGVGVSINVATDLKTTVWAWVAVVALTLAVAGVAVWTQRPSREPAPSSIQPAPAGTYNQFSGKARTVVQADDIHGAVTVNNNSAITTKRAAFGVATAVALLAGYVMAANWYSDNIDWINKTPPFKAQFLFDTKVPANWVIVLDRKLTPDEIAGLEKLDGTDGEAVWGYLRPLGGRLIPNGEHLFALEDGATETFHMPLLSDRHQTLTIENISTTNVKCAPSTAVTVIDFPSQGNTEVDGVAFMLRAPNKPMMQMGENGIADHDYFAKHQIDLGAGATPGALLVTVVGRWGMSCSWDFTADYATVDGQSTFTFNNNGTPLTLESRPDRPLQHIQFGQTLAGGSKLAWYDCATPGIVC